MSTAVQRAIERIQAIRDTSKKISEDFLNGNAINWFEDDELGFEEGDLLKFLETPLYEQMTKAYTKAYYDKHYKRMLDREFSGVAEATGGNWGTGVSKVFQQFIPRKVYSKMIETLYERRIGRELLTRTIGGVNSQGITFPKQGDRMVATPINEMTPIPLQGVTFTKIRVTPYQVGVGFALSDEIVEEANVDLIRMLLEEVAWAIAEKEDNDIMACILDKAGTKNTSKTFGITQWTADMQTLEDQLYSPDVVVAGNTIATYFRRMPDFTDGTNFHTSPDILQTMIRKGWIGSYFGIPIKRLHTSRLATGTYIMLNNSNLRNPVSVFCIRYGLRFNRERSEAYRAQMTYAHTAYAPAVLNPYGIVTTGCTS
jgi:hypothetical protein